MSKMSYTDYVTLVDILESTSDAGMKTPHFYFQHEKGTKCHAVVTKSNTVYDYVQRTAYPDLMSWAEASLALLPSAPGVPLRYLCFGDATHFLDIDEILEALEWTFEVPKAPQSGGAGAGAGLAAVAPAPAPAPAPATAPARSFIPTRSRKVFEILRKIERCEALTEEEGKTELFDDEEDGLKIAPAAASTTDSDSSYAPSEATEDEEDGMADLTGRMDRCRVAVAEARKEADRAFQHMMSLATTHAASPQIVAAVRKTYEQQKQREMAAAVQLAGAYLDDRGFFGYAPNVGKILDKELGEYAYIAKEMLQ
jgi:hypothetical protein